MDHQKWILFIDDLRDPGYVSTDIAVLERMKVARSSEEAIALIAQLGIPIFIYFDHDLGGEDTAMRLVNWMIDRDLDTGLMGEGVEFFVHSSNPVGKQNIEGKLGQYLEFRKQSNAMVAQR